jgi:hypothetical protein
MKLPRAVPGPGTRSTAPSMTTTPWFAANHSATPIGAGSLNDRLTISAEYPHGRSRSARVVDAAVPNPSNHGVSAKYPPRVLPRSFASARPATVAPESSHPGPCPDCSWVAVRIAEAAAHHPNNNAASEKCSPPASACVVDAVLCTPPSPTVFSARASLRRPK